MNDAHILLGHGSGGSMMKRLIDEVFFAGYGSDTLLQANDASVVHMQDSRIALSTDSFVVTPQFFPGGDIGRLAVCGTVNDVATSGATVKALSCAFILEEGYPTQDLKRIVASMRAAAQEAGVEIVTGDTKVVSKGQGDGVYINTTGLGVLEHPYQLGASQIRPGDLVLISGTIGDHGICIMSQREGLSFDAEVTTDAAPLNHLIASVLQAAPNTRCFRDPTRGGLASTLNEFAETASVDIEIDEAAVPMHPTVQAACEMLGYDIFQVANEGKMVAVVPPEEAEAALEAMRASKYGKQAALIGKVCAPRQSAHPMVFLNTPFGSSRILDMLVGEQLPRIC